MTDIETRAKKHAEFIAKSHNAQDASVVYNNYIQIAIEQQEIDIQRACDVYCKVCGHFAHTTPTQICRHDCPYYSDFEKAMKGE